MFNKTIELERLPEYTKAKEQSAVMSNTFSRRSLALGLAALPVGFAVADGLAAPTMAVNSKAPVDGLAHTAEAIQQQVTLDASPQRVYRALTTTKDFDMITRLSDGEVLLKAAGAQPTSISGEIGGPFTLFGGYVTGRHLEMLPNERLVQAWRAGSWKPGDFSIAVFYLSAEGAKTKLNFEHRGFPNGNGATLAQGWHSHYWQPLAKYLAQG
jgi:activator of HSP90 ATPase